MKLQGCDRLQLFLMGAVAAGAFGSIPQLDAADPVPRVQPTAGQGPVQIQPVAQSPAPAKKSEVMRQLELLYEKDGREMPDLNTEIRPVPTGPATASPAAASNAAGPPARAMTQPTSQGNTGLRTQQATQAKQPAQVQQAPVAPAPIPQEPPKSRNPVVAFFKKLLPGQKDPKPTKPAPDYRPDVAPVPPATLATNGLATDARTANLPLLDSVPRSPSAVTTDVTADPLPAPLVDLPAPTGPAELPQPAEKLPPLLTEPAGNPATASAENPFSEMSEAEADQKLNGSPFTGLTLDDDSATTKSANAGPETPPSLDVPPAAEDPFADELEKMGLVPPTGGEQTIPTPAESPAAADLETRPVELPVPAATQPTEPPTLATPNSDTPTFDGIEDAATREKMKKIHERGSMKGLKGFCPVTLRDQRELVDAKPDFHSTFRGQKFHFADADAKLKFDEEPARYAPAAYGADVVALSRDNDVVEGSLDHAAWFKGRLYLFGSKESHDTFVADPAKYATPVGIE